MLQPKFQLTRLALSYWTSRESLSAWTFTLLVTLCTIIIVILNLLLNKWQAGFYNQLQQYNVAGFMDTLLQFLLISCIYVVSSGYQAYFRLILQLRWRQWLTEGYIQLWLHNRTYYHLTILGSSIDNPAQRISEDIHLFVTHTLDLILGLLRHIVTLVAFSMVLWQLSGTITVVWQGQEFIIAGYMVWAAFLYSALGTWVTVRIGRPLVTQSVNQQTNEAEFRACLDRLKEHDECIVLYGGEGKEQLNLMKHFKKIALNCLNIARSTKTLTLLSTAYSQGSVVFAFLVAAPRYFNNEIQLGQLFEISGAYWYVHSALSYIIDSYNKVALWKALTYRLDHFSFAMTEVHHLAKAEGSIMLHKTSCLKIANLTVLSLSGEKLIKNLTFDLQMKDRLLISGPTGSGKTTLFRTLSGVWPNFTGQVIKPANQYTLFLPQTPYFPIDTLRNVILYPHITQDYSDEKLADILLHCKLPRLADKLSHVDDWGKLLSVGEQQCLSIARAILHQPKWLFLDEATASMDTETEHHIYCLLQQTMPNTALISIGHRETLHEHHNLNLQIDKNGNWKLRTLANPSKSNNKTAFII
ncbi:ABC transporter ATP-binding protein/permease [bacterium BFN5]|nr:ABC transporter ATP-binding protein/permease [bacterium BFN5]